jgi:acetylornithine deacetylase
LAVVCNARGARLPVCDDAAMRDAIRRELAARHDDLIDLTARLVRVPSVLGAEEPAQAIVEERLRGMGFAVERVPLDDEAALADPHGGYPPLPGGGDRTCVAGRIAGTDGARSLHLSGHVDVVPVDGGERWSRDPFGAEIADGRMWGRGTCDMKAGLAAYLIGAEAALAVCGPPQGDLLLTSVIEEECGGNGMRAVVAAGYDADWTLIGEPSGLALDHGGVGVIWFRLTASGDGEHAARASLAVPPVDQLVTAIAALRALEAQLNADPADEAFAALAHPYNLNLGELRAGVWPSSVPTDAVLRARLGFGRDLEPVAAQAFVRDAVAAAAPAVEVSFEGFRAPAYVHDPASDLAALLGACHVAVHGGPPPHPYVSTATTDARFVAGPCYCYGPAGGMVHGIEEWVDLDTVRATAATIALVVARAVCGAA